MGINGDLCWFFLPSAETNLPGKVPLSPLFWHCEDADLHTASSWQILITCGPSEVWPPCQRCNITPADRRKNEDTLPGMVLSWKGVSRLLDKLVKFCLTN
jgi:hypothetical protein